MIGKNIRALTLILFVLVLAVALVVGCTSSSGQPAGDASVGAGDVDTSASEEAQGVDTEESEPITVRYVGWNIEPRMLWKEWQRIYDENNLTMEWSIQPRGEYMQQLDLLVASGDLPDIALVDISRAEVYGAGGVFLPLNDLIDQHAPNLKSYIEAHPDMQRLITAADGNIYALPHIAEPGDLTTSWFYREDYLEHTSLDGAPQDLDEFTQYLREVKAANPGGQEYFYPLSFTFGVDGPMWQLAATFDAQAKINDGELQGVIEGDRGYDRLSPAYREMIDYVRILYEEELLDPEFASQTEDAWGAKMINSQAAVTMHAATRLAWFNSAGFDPARAAELPEGYKMAALLPFPNADGERLLPVRPQFQAQQMHAITANASDPVRIIQFYDFLFSEEGIIKHNFGWEGETYEKVGDPHLNESRDTVEGGEFLFILDYLVDTTITPPDTTEERYRFSPSGAFAWPRPTLMESQLQRLPDDQRALYELLAPYTYSYPVLKYTAEESERIAIIQAQLDELNDSLLINFIKGDKPMAEWEDYTDAIVSAGYLDLHEIQQTAYDRMFK